MRVEKDKTRLLMNACQLISAVTVYLSSRSVKNAAMSLGVSLVYAPLPCVQLRRTYCKSKTPIFPVH